MSLRAGQDAPPPHHLMDWTAWGWGWVLGITGTVLLFVAAIVAMKIFVDAEPSGYRYSYSRDDNSARTRLVTGVVTVVSAACGGVLSWYVARHFSSFEFLWWILPFVVAGIFFYLGYNSYRSKPMGYSVAGLLTAGGLFAAANDGLSRVAADIPIALSALVGFLVLGAIFAVAYILTSSKR